MWDLCFIISVEILAPGGSCGGDDVLVANLSVSCQPHPDLAVFLSMNTLILKLHLLIFVLIVNYERWSETITFLLRHGVDVNMELRGGCCGSVLGDASGRGNPMIVDS